MAIYVLENRQNQQKNNQNEVHWKYEKEFMSRYYFVPILINFMNAQ